MPIAITRNAKLIRLKTIVIDNGRKKARTGIHAGHAPRRMPTDDPRIPTFLFLIEQHLATALSYT